MLCLFFIIDIITLWIISVSDTPSGVIREYDWLFIQLSALSIIQYGKLTFIYINVLSCPLNFNWSCRYSFQQGIEFNVSNIRQCAIVLVMCQLSHYSFVDKHVW
jgi:hypothetical protein